MNKKILFATAPIILTVSALLTTSCNGANRIKRESFNAKEYAKAVEVFDKAKAKQEESFLSKATCNIKYSIKASGDARVEGVSFHNFNVNFSAGYTISYSIKDQYVKIKGEKETLYYVNLNNSWWEFQDYISGGTRKTYKIDRIKHPSKYFKYDDFQQFVVDVIDDYSSIAIPTIFNLGVGITGDNSYVEGFLEQDLLFEPDYFFDDEIHNFFEELGKKYKEENEGYSSTYTCGSNDDNTLCASLKGKYKASDIHSHKQKLGAINLDLFSSYKNGFISQAEFIASGNVYTTQMNNLNVDFDVYLSEEVDQDKCNIDTINPNDYTEYNPIS